MKYKLYLAKLKRGSRGYKKPNCVYKIGITRHADAETRLRYDGLSESLPLVKIFDDIKVMRSIWLDSKGEAEALESQIMETIKSEANERRFHNWYEDKNFSGVTEARIWNYDEVQRVFELINESSK